MFSALNQGSLVYILDKTKNVKFSIGEVVGTTVPQYAICLLYTLTLPTIYAV